MHETPHGGLDAGTVPPWLQARVGLLDADLMEPGYLMVELIFEVATRARCDAGDGLNLDAYLIAGRLLTHLRGHVVLPAASISMPTTPV